jgi:predicted pyridoxine 5'-phosphate oxidase superfamily flavin-nucleotide-binding protein
MKTSPERPPAADAGKASGSVGGSAAGGRQPADAVHRRPAYHDGMRRLQDRFDSRRLADRLDETLSRTQFTAEDRAFIESRTLFFLATADAGGRPDCSYKGGAAGFVRVTDVDQLAFPSYDGNGMFRSIGNLRVNPAVALLFIDFERPQRLRVNGSAHVQFDDPLLESFAGAQLVVRVRAARIFPNCPRYIHQLKLIEASPYVPRAGATPPVPAWKRFEMFRDVLPSADPARGDAVPPAR